MRVYVRFKDGRSHTISRVVNLILDEDVDILAATNRNADGTTHVWSCPLSEVRTVSPKSLPATREQSDVV